MEYDDKNIRELHFLLENYSKDSLSTMKTLHMTEETINEFPDRKVFSLFRSLTLLSISYSTFKDFNANTIARSCPLLRKIELTGCVIPSVKLLLPLGNLAYLEELDLSKSSIDMDRYYLISYLLFGHTIIETCDRKKKIPRAFIISRSILSKNKPAPVPRQSPFPLLQLLNNERITEDEIETVKPKHVKVAKTLHSDRILEKVKKTNHKILEDKEKFGSFRSLLATSSFQTIKKPKIDTLAQIKFEKLCTTEQEKESSFETESQDSQSSEEEESWADVDRKRPFLPTNKEEVEEFLQRSEKLREKAEKPLEKKNYGFDEVSFFMYGKRVQDSGRVNAVSEVMRIVNGVKLSFGIPESEVLNRLKNKKLLSVEEIYEFQKILELDDEIKNLRLQSGYFEWWIKKIEKKHVEFAEHKAIIALHRKRIFENPLIWDKSEIKVRKRRVVRMGSSVPAEVLTTARKRLVLDEEPKYFVANFSALFDPSEIKEGESIFIKPIVSFEESIEKLQSQLREKERQFEALSFGDKVVVKLEMIKNNIKEREGVRDKLTNLYEQVSKLKKKFQENQTEFFFNMYEKRLDKRELLQKHDFKKFALPTFVFPM